MTWKLWNRVEKNIGMEIKDTVLKMVEVQKSRDKRLLVNFLIEQIPEGLVSEGRIIDREKFEQFLFLTKNKAGIESKNLHLSVSSQNILLRPLRLPNLPEKELAKVVHLEIENTLQLPFEEYVSDFVIITDQAERTTAKEVDLMLVIAPKPYIQDYVDTLQAVGFHLRSIDLAPLAVQRMMADRNTPQTFMIANIGEKNTEVGIVHQRALRLMHIFSQEFSKVQEGSFAGLQDAQRWVEYQERQGRSNSILEDFGREIERIMNFYLYTLNNRNQTISEVNLVGDPENMQQLVEFLSGRLDIPVRVVGYGPVEVAPHLEATFQSAAPALIVPTGLAIKDVKA